MVGKMKMYIWNKKNRWQIW